MRRLAVALTVATLALVAASGIAWASFTVHRTTPQTFTAVDSFEPPPVSGVLKASSRTNDGGVSSSQIQLGLKLQNVGDGSVDLTEVTMRYWFTSDGATSTLDTACYFVTSGCGRLRMSVVHTGSALDGADHYFQVGFSSGRIAAGAGIPLEQLAIVDHVGHVFDQSDDFSFLNKSAFTENPKVTVYLRGELVWGTEPADLPDVESLAVQYRNGDPDPFNQSINPYLAVGNTGTVDIGLADVTLRYWFTRDTPSDQLLAFCDYAVVSCSKVTLKTVPITARPGADTYLEVGFTTDVLEVGASTDLIQLRVHRADWGLFDETNDYSWGTNTSFKDWTKVTAYVKGRLVWGTEP